MKTLIATLDIRSLMRTDEAKPTTILCLAALLLSIHRYFGSIEFGVRTFSGWSEMQASLFMFTTAFVLLGLLPLALVVFVFKEKPSEYGLGIGNGKLGAGMNLVLFPVIAIALLYPASQTAEMRAFYPFAKVAGSSMQAFLALEIPRVILFYTAWEFFFRGFMLFGLRRYVGDWLAICIQTIPSCLWHIGMPTGELLSSIAGGVLFGVMAIRTNSIFWPFLLHCLIGLGVDSFIILTT